jgi:DNA-directed RNA polymerase alpha subunit
MPRDEKRTCKTCQFWHECDGLTEENIVGPEPEKYGFCKRNPPLVYLPVIVPADDTHADDLIRVSDNWHHPVRSDCDWCGEWKKVMTEAEAAIPVSALGLSTRTRKILHRMNVTTLAELVENTEIDLLERKNCGMVSLQEIKDRLLLFGFSLKGGLI